MGTFFFCNFINCIKTSRCLMSLSHLLPVFLFSAAWLGFNQTLHPIQQLEPEQPSKPQLPTPQSAYSGWSGTHPGWLRAKRKNMSHPHKPPLHFLIPFLPLPSIQLEHATKCQDSTCHLPFITCPNLTGNKNVPSFWFLGEKTSTEWSWETDSLKVWAAPWESELILCLISGCVSNLPPSGAIVAV